MCNIASRMSRPVVVVASPDRTEAAQLCDWLRAEGLEPMPVLSLHTARHEVQSRKYDVLIADAAFAFDGDLQAIARANNARAPLVVVGGNATARARAERNGISHVERPVDPAVLLCHVTMAIAEGRPPRRSPRKCITPFQSVVEGAPAYIIDVSNEGLRLALSRRRLAPAPQFTVRIPLIGTTLTVRRVWVGSAGAAENSDTAVCGVELFRSGSRAEQSWRTFVSTVSGRMTID